MKRFKFLAIVAVTVFPLILTGCVEEKEKPRPLPAYSKGMFIKVEDANEDDDIAMDGVIKNPTVVKKLINKINRSSYISIFKTSMDQCDAFLTIYKDDKEVAQLGYYNEPVNAWITGQYIDTNKDFIYGIIYKIDPKDIIKESQ
ncbi:hypothetical protein ACFO4N_10000 [Camelliibacillus cellulosilyticus]|uniref:Lipoprotein n=1 Tax=Camelliibacillus cellulosilyticus TaxID=2174486 RepID=A0ABV9GNA3_9BACL